MDYRTETDLLGDYKVPQKSLAGIHTFRALDNFGSTGVSVHPRLLCAFGYVKLACLKTNNILGYLDDSKTDAISRACSELIEGRLACENTPAALQGGAGTSTNMYVNEILANRALEIMGQPHGSYEIISPLDDVNLHQSTNDTYPTALRVAAMFACRQLEQTVSETVDCCQKNEKLFADIVKLGRTQLQDAVPMTVGSQFGAYAEAFSRDRWRISKCQERLRVVNLGGTAIGTGLGAPKKYIFMVTDQLRQLTNLPLARAENLIQATQNCDDIVEVSGILKALASNTFKIGSDLRLLSSGPAAGLGELKLPQRQAGSSIMPGKVNPVIAEMACQAAISAISRDAAVTMAAMSGQLELNAFMPLIAHNLLIMIDELITAITKLRLLLLEDIEVNRDQTEKNVHNSTAVITAFVHRIGYHKASEIIRKAAAEDKTIKQMLIESGICTEEEYKYATSSEAVLALGFREDRI